MNDYDVAAERREALTAAYHAEIPSIDMIANAWMCDAWQRAGDCAATPLESLLQGRKAFYDGAYEAVKGLSQRDRADLAAELGLMPSWPEWSHQQEQAA